MRKPTPTFTLPAFIIFASLGGALAHAEANSVGYEVLRDAVAQRVKTFGREVVLYNYLGNSSRDYVDPKSGMMKNYATRLTNQYLNPSTEHPSSFKLGSGLYLAADPINSKRYTNGYGGWNLMALHFKPATRFLDLRGDGEKPIPLAGKPLANLDIDDQGCDNFECTQLRPATCELSSLYGLFTDTGTKDCRAIALRLVHDLHIQLVGYLWDGLNYAPCDVKPKDASLGNTANIAFVLADLNAIDWSASNYLSPSLPKTSDTADFERQVIGEIVHRANLNGAEDPYPKLNKTIADSDFDAFVKRAHFGCATQTYPQDKNQ
jgi:hypothetical protein